MPIARSADGVLHNFPEGTPNSVIDRVMLEYAQAQAQKAKGNEALERAAGMPVVGAQSAVGATRSVFDTAGTENPISRNMRMVENVLGALTPAATRRKIEENAAIGKEAEDKGILAGIKSGFKQVANAPDVALAQGLGSMIPNIGLTAVAPESLPLRLGAMGLFGAAQGAGTIKGSIRDSVYQELRERGLSEEQATAAAVKAQSYGGGNLDSIALGAIIGAVTSTTGVEGAVAKAMGKEVAESLVTKGLVRRGVEGLAKEGGTEGFQGGQEQFSGNLALRRAGIDVPLMRGVAGAATQEGIIGGVLGGGAEMVLGGERAPPPTPPGAPPPPSGSAPAQGTTPPPSGGPTPIPPINYAAGFSPADIEARLTTALGGVAPNKNTEATIKAVTRKFGSSLAPNISDPDSALDYLERGPAKYPAQRGKRYDSDQRAAEARVVDEARSIINDYYGMQQAAAGPTAAATAPPPAAAAPAAPSPPMATLTVTPTAAPTATPAVPPAPVAPPTVATTPSPAAPAAVPPPTVKAAPPANPITAAKAVVAPFVPVGPNKKTTNQIIKTAAERIVADPTLDPKGVVDTVVAELAPAPAPATPATAEVPEDIAALRKQVAFDESVNAKGPLAQDRRAQLEEAEAKLLAEANAAQASAVEEAPVVEEAPAEGGETTEQPAEKPKRPIEEFAAYINAFNRGYDTRGNIAPTEREKMSSSDLDSFEEGARVGKEADARVRDQLDRVEAGEVTEADGVTQSPVLHAARAVKEAGVPVDAGILGRLNILVDQARSAPDPNAVLDNGIKQLIQAAQAKPKKGKGKDKPSLSTQEPPTGAPGGIRSKRSMDMEKAGARVRLAAELNKRLAAMGLPDIKARVADSIEEGSEDSPRSVEGYYFKKVVEVALDAKDHVGVLSHEVIHALRKLGVVSPAEWTALTKQAVSEWMDKYDIANRYSDLPHDKQVEEAVSEAYRDHVTAARTHKIPAIQRVFKKIKDYFRTVRDTMRKAEFKRPEDFFDAVDRGVVGRRERQLYKVIEQAPGKTAGEKVLSIAKQEIENTPVADLIEQANITPFDPLYETIRATPGVNVTRITKLLGPHLYGDPTNMGLVCIKEVLQNSFDAVRSAVSNKQVAKGKIEISISKDQRTLTVKDNGVGMAPSLLGGKFLEIAGSAKEGDKNSGGFGIAKMLFLYANKHIRVVTAQNGRIAELDVAGQQLKEALQDPDAAPDITVRDFEPVDWEAFPDGHGTIIQLTIPEQDGEYKVRELPAYPDNVLPVMKSPLFADIDVTFNSAWGYKNEALPIGSNFPIKDYMQFVGVKFPWGTAKVYVTREAGGETYTDNMHILSNGLWQFSTSVRKDPNNAYGPRVPYTFYVDLIPTVRPEDAGYPFNFNRQSFTEDAQKSFARIKSYIDAIYAYKTSAGDATSFGQIQYFDDNGNLSGPLDITPEIPVQNTAFSGLHEGAQVTVSEDGVLLVDGKVLPDLTPEQLKKGIPSAADLKVDPSLINTDAVMVHENTDVVILDTNERILLADFMRREFGDRFDSFMYMAGDAFLTLRDEVARIMGYSELLKEAVGVSLDPEYRGVSIRLPFSGSFINPLVPEYADGKRAGYGIMGTMIHELAHHKVRSHNADFPAEMQRLLINLHSDPSFDFNTYQTNFALAVAEEYGDIVSRGVELFNGQNPDIRVEHRGNRFTDGSSEQVPEGTGRGSAEDLRESGREGGSGKSVLGPSLQRPRTARGRGNTGGSSAPSASQPAAGVGHNNPPSTPNNPTASRTGDGASLYMRFKKFASEWRRLIDNKYQDAWDFVDQLTNALGIENLPDEQNLKRAFTLYETSKSGKLRELDRQFFTPIMNRIMELGLHPQDVGMYLWARSAAARNKMVAEINGKLAEGGSGLTNAEAKNVLDTLDAAGLTDKLKEVAAMHDKLVDHILREKVKAGLLTRAEAIEMKKEQPFYASLKGFAADGDMMSPGDDPDTHADFNSSRRMGNSRSEFMKVKGRTTMPLNPLINLFVDAQKAVNRVETQEVGNTFLKILQANPDATENIAKVYTDKDPEIIQKLTDPNTGQVVTSRKSMWLNDKKYLLVKQDGEIFYIKFQDTAEGKAVQRAFSNMTPPEAAKVMRLWITVNNTLKSLLTHRSAPYLMGPAFIRDVSDAVATAYAAQTDKKSPAFGKKLGNKVTQYLVSPKMWPKMSEAIRKYVWGVAPSSAEEIDLMDKLAEMIENGGSVGATMVKDAETFAREAQNKVKAYAKASKGDPLAYGKRTVDMLSNVLDSVAEGQDLHARFATYLAALDLGISVKDAAALALDSSLNLSRRGEWGRVLDQYIWFFSPTVQGARKLIKTGLNPRNGMKIMLTMAALGAGLAVWNNGMSGDDDDDGEKDWLDVNDTTRMTRIVVFYGHGADDYVKIPIGFLLAYPKYVGEKIAEAGLGITSGEDVSTSIMNATLEVGRGFATAVSPLRTSGGDIHEAATSLLVPSIAKPGFDILVTNRNFFGNPIFTDQQDTSVAKSSLGRTGTGEVWKMLAQGMNRLTGGLGNIPAKKGLDLQPEAYRYLVESFGGGNYKVVRDLVSMKPSAPEKGMQAKDIPIVKGYVGSGSEYTPINKYYDNTYRMDSMLRSARHDDPETWAANRKKFPLETDPQVLAAYYLVDQYKDKVGDARKELLQPVQGRKSNLPKEEQTKIVDASRVMQSEAFKKFNRVYNQRKRALESQ